MTSGIIRRFHTCVCSCKGQSSLKETGTDVVLSKTTKKKKKKKKVKSNEDVAKSMDTNGYVELLRKCNHFRFLEELRSLHSQLIGNGLYRSGPITTELIKMYGKCGSLEDAYTVFESTQAKDRNFQTWNAMIVACMNNGDSVGARQIFNCMPGKDVTAANSMIVAYGKSKTVEEARRLFIRMRHRNDVTWTSMVAAYAQNGHSRDAKKLFDSMPWRGIVTFTCMLTACARLGHIEDSWKLFHEMRERDVYAWCALISVLSRHSLVCEVRSVFHRMPETNGASWNATITAYAKGGHLDEARELFDIMPQPDVITWTSLITALAQQGYSRDALEMFKSMDLEGIEADKFTFSIALDACARLSDVAEGRILHRTYSESGLKDVVVGNSLLNMYGKCGSLDEALAVFQSMPSRVIATWNALIAAYTENGLHQAAFETFGLLNLDGSLKPDSITFIGIFTACSHTGKVEGAREYFMCMNRDFDVVPVADHYVCMADLLGRVGRLAQGEELLNKMPFYADPAAWLGLMGSCRTHLNAEIAERAAEYVYDWDPECPSPYILLSNIYAALGRTRDVIRIRRLMKMRGVKNKRALSFVQVRNKMLPFAVAPWTSKFYKEHCRWSSTRLHEEKSLSREQAAFAK